MTLERRHTDQEPAARRLSLRKRSLTAGLCILLALVLFAVWRATDGASTPQKATPSSLTLPAGAPLRPPASGGKPASSPLAGRVGEGSASTPPLSPGGKAALKQGITALKSGDFPAAAHAFEEAVKADPASPLTHDYLGIAYLRQTRFDAALHQFQEENRLAPTSATGWARIADVYYAQNNRREAIRALEQGVALQPDLAQLYYNLGMLYPQELELNKAITALTRYSDLEPGNHYAHYLRGSLLYKLARLDDAERALQEAIRLAPETSLYHFALAQVCFRRMPSREMTERVRSELQQALDLGAPEPAAVHYYLGLCHQRQGDLATARRELETSVQIAPEAWGAYYALAEVLQKSGHLEEARKARARFAALRAQEDVRMKRDFYLQEVERNPESADAHYQLAAFLIGQEDRSGASKALAQAARLAAANHDSPALRARITALSDQLKRGR